MRDQGLIFFGIIFIVTDGALLLPGPSISIIVKEPMNTGRKICREGQNITGKVTMG